MGRIRESLISSLGEDRYTLPTRQSPKLKRMPHTSTELLFR